jgi:N6-adenosine-specific RNA methylase IME4
VERALAEQIRQRPPPLPSGPFDVVVVDPPWPYPEGMLPYPSIDLDQVAEIPIPQLLAENAVVWLWTTNRFMYQALRIAIECWQLEQQNILTWDKQRPGTGHWLRGETEHCLLLRRGNPTFLQENHTTILRARAREHSRKPDEFYTLVEETCPGAKVELFSRQQRAGWHAHGAETDLYPAEMPDATKP